MNTIISNNLGENNSMNSLTFYWKAKFLNGDTIFQFDSQGIEHRFQEVKDQFNELIEFSLYNKEKCIIYTVDLINGLIYNNQVLKEKQESQEKKENIRLIFFRRHRVEINTQDLKEKNHEITYYLGFQYNDKQKNNQKIIFQIDSEGNWILGE